MRTHARTHARTHTHSRARSHCDCVPQARRLSRGARIVLMSSTFGEEASSEGCFRPRRVRAEEPRHAFEVDMDFGAVLFYVYERV